MAMVLIALAFVLFLLMVKIFVILSSIVLRLVFYRYY